MKKNKIIMAVVFWTFAIGIVTSIILFYRADAIENNEQERTKEEYISIFLDNKEDFEYVAEIMLRFPSGYIDFNNGIALSPRINIYDFFSCGDREIAIEILTNEEFYEHLINLYNLDEIDFIYYEGSSTLLPEKKEVSFYLKNIPDYQGALYHGTHITIDSCTYKIDENWALRMIPNI